MAPGNVDLIRPIYDEWGRGNWQPRPEVYDPHMEWGWSDDFPGLAGVYEDNETPNPRLRAWLSPWEHWRVEVDEYLEVGDHVVVLASYIGRGKAAESRSARRARTCSSCATGRSCGSRSSPTGGRRWSRSAPRPTGRSTAPRSRSVAGSTLSPPG